MPKFKNVIITCPFFIFFNSLFCFIPVKELTKLFPEKTEIPDLLCVSQGADLAGAGSAHRAASCSPLPEGAFGRGADAALRPPGGIWKRPAGRRRRNPRHRSHVPPKTPTVLGQAHLSGLSSLLPELKVQR